MPRLSELHLPHIPRKQRRILRRIGLTLLGILVLFALALQTRPARDRIRRELVRQVKDAIHLDAVVQDIRIGYFPPEVRAVGVRLSHPTEGLLARAAEVSVTPRLLPIFVGRVEIGQITVESADVRLVVRDGRIANVPVLRKRGETETADELPFGDLALSDSHVSVEAPGYGTAELSGIDLDLAVEGRRDVLLRLFALSGEVVHARGHERIRRLEIRAGLLLGIVQLHRLAIETEDAKVRLTEGLLPVPYDGSMRAKVAFDVPASMLNRMPLEGLPTFSGRVGGQFALRLAEGIPSADGVMTGKDLVIDGYRVYEEARIPLSLDPHGIVVRRDDPGVLHVAQSETTVYGTIDFDERLTTEAWVHVRHVRFEELVEGLLAPNSHCTWRANAIGRWRGSLNPFRLDSVGDVRVEVSDLRASIRGFRDPEPHGTVIHVPSAEYLGGVTFDGVGVRFTNARVKWGHSELAVAAHLRLRGDFEVHASGETVELADFGPLTDIPWAGRGRLRFDISGPFEDPTIVGHAKVAGFEFQTFRFGDVEADLHYRNLVLRATNGTMQKENSRFAIETSSLEFGGEHLAATANVVGTNVHLDEFRHTWRLEEDPDFRQVNGVVDGTAEVRLANDVLDVDWEIAGNGIHAYRERFDQARSSGHWTWIDREAGWRGGSIELRETSLRKGSGTISIEGRTRRGGALDLLVVADRVDTAGLERDPLAEYRARGVLSLLAQVRGTADVPEVDAQISLRDVRIAGRPAPPAEARVALHGPQARIVGRVLGSAVGFDLGVARAAPHPIHGTITLDQLRLVSLLGPRAVVDAVASGRIEIDRAVPSALGRSRARIRLSDLRASRGGYTLASRGPVEVDLADGGFRIGRAAFVGRDADFGITGGADRSGRLDVHVGGAVDLGILPSLSDSVTAARGLVRADCTVRGTIDRPAVLGSATLAQGSLEVVGVEDRFEGVSGRVTFSERRVLFEDFHGRLGGATLAGGGSLDFEGLAVAAYDTHFDVRGFTVGLDEAGTNAVLDGRAGIAWREGRERPLLSGDLRVTRLRYRKDFVVTRDLGEQARRRANRAEVESFEPGSEKLDLDVRLHAARDIWIQNSLVDAELKIDETQGPFRLVGTDRRPGLLGTLSVLRGSFYFRNATFRVQSGTIVFRDANRIQPHFDFQAESDVRDWRIQLQAMGTPDDFRLFTRADPYLSEEDVLLVLTLGLTQQELADADVAQVGGAAAVDALAEVSGVDREVRRIMAIDDVRVGSSYSPETGRTEPNVTVGRRFSRNVRASATAGLSESRSVSANVEWRLSNSVSVEGGYDNGEQTASSNLGNVGVDLRWRLDFE